MLLFIWNNELYGLLTMMLAQEGKKEFFEKDFLDTNTTLQIWRVIQPLFIINQPTHF